MAGVLKFPKDTKKNEDLFQNNISLLDKKKKNLESYLVCLLVNSPRKD